MTVADRESRIDAALKARQEYEDAPDEDKGWRSRAWLWAEAELDNHEYALYIKRWQERTRP
jgi:hypothetical protein